MGLAFVCRVREEGAAPSVNVQPVFLEFLAAKRAALESTMCGVCVSVIARFENSLSPFKC